MKHILRDGDPGLEFRDQTYRAYLRETATVMLMLARYRVSNCADAKGDENYRPEVNAAYERGMSILAQLPMEWGHRDYRYNRSRWRLDVCNPGPTGSELDVHCEHPWTKLGTRLLCLACAKHAGGEDERSLDFISEVLDARQDTVLLPCQKVTHYGVLAGRADGLFERYEGIGERGHKLIERRTGEEIDNDAMREVSRGVNRRILAAAAKIGVDFVSNIRVLGSLGSLVG